MTSTSTEITISQKTQQAIDQIRSPQVSAEIEAALPEGVSPRQFLRAGATALMDNPALANADRTSLVKALFKCAQDGLLPDGRDAALVIFKDNKDGGKQKVQYMSMIAGLRRIAAEHDIAIHASVVYENDEFEPDLEAHKANHKPTRLGQDQGNPVGAYAIAQHRDGRRFGPAIMDVKEIERIRAKSKMPNSPAWKDWWDRMAEKTVARRLWKELPFSSKDRERLQRLGADEADESAADPADVLYGQDAGDALEKSTEADRPPENVDPESGEVIEEADWSDGSAEDAPFEGEEPPIEEAPAVEMTAVFTSGRYEGKTVQEVFDIGDEGVRYVAWAFKNWKTDPMLSSLAAFAEQHPEIKS